MAGGVAYATIALRRGETLNSAYILTAALCTYAIGYRFYSRFVAARVTLSLRSNASAALSVTAPVPSVPPMISLRRVHFIAPLP